MKMQLTLPGIQSYQEPPGQAVNVQCLVGPLVVCYGAGTNSTGELVGLHERGIRPDYIIFADTVGEKPWTYGHLQAVDEWCKRVDFPRITVVTGCYPQQIRDGSLENELLRLCCLPAKALGYKTCSVKWKIEPTNRWLKQQGVGEHTRLIGFDFGEPDRAENARYAKLKDKRINYVQRFPLMEWFWTRDDCKAAIDRAGLPQPGKSACFFCPSSTKEEILSLPPDLLDRALEIERRAMSSDHGPTYTNVRGLGRQFAWRDLVNFSNAGLPLFNFADPPPVECNCYDG